MEIHELHTPVGKLRLLAEGEYLEKIEYSEQSEGDRSDHPVLVRASAQLEEYFAGDRTEFDLPLKPDGTDFQQRVWQKLSEVPFGRSITYRDLAERLGDPNTIRAVGRANGQNPIPVIIPCHRVIGSDGRLVGYSGGIDRKRWLLKHEGALLI